MVYRLRAYRKANPDIDNMLREGMIKLAGDWKQHVNSNACLSLGQARDFLAVMNGMVSLRKVMKESLKDVAKDVEALPVTSAEDIADIKEIEPLADIVVVSNGSE